MKVGDKVYSDDGGFIEGFISEIVETPLHPLIKFRAIIKAKVVNDMGVEYKNINTSSFHINPLVTSNKGWTDYGSFGKMFFFTTPDGIKQFYKDYNNHMIDYHIGKAKYYGYKV